MSPDFSKMVPFVLKKNWKREPFNPERIYNSILTETELSEKDARYITHQVTRYLISIGDKIKMVTAPMIREFVCITLLVEGFELARLQYTRIGFPKHDLNELNLRYANGKKNRLIVEHVQKENENVDILIDKIRKNKK